MVEEADVEKAVWELAAWFRNAEPVGWQPRSIEFERDLGILRAASSRWQVSATVRGGGIGGAQFEIAVMITQDDEHGARGLAARRRMRLFEFLEATEKKMWRLRYGGTFDIDKYDGECGGHFNKYVAGTKAIQRELEALSSLRIGLRDGQPTARRKRLR